jgi:hypothetical protein
VALTVAPLMSFAPTRGVKLFHQKARSGVPCSRMRSRLLPPLISVCRAACELGTGLPV